MKRNLFQELRDAIDPVGAEWRDRHAQLTAERDRLRSALIATGRNLGALLGDDVTTDFLIMVSDEARLSRKKAEGITAERDRLKSALTRLRHSWPTEDQTAWAYAGEVSDIAEEALQEAK